MQVEQFYKLISETNKLTTETAKDLEGVVKKFPFFQLAWLLYLKNLKVIDSPEFETVLKRTAVRVSNRKLMYRFLNDEIITAPPDNDLQNQESSENKSEQEEEKHSSNLLIDKFLQGDYGVIRQNPDETKDKPNDQLKEVAEKSVEENEEIITETLANIYFQQKNYEKALDAFEKLSLKYPEKSVYFASRIKEIEEIKNK
jgi:tetratricopeptide (TPR) repeat protein